MMKSVLDSYDSAVEKMDKLKQEGKINTVTYKQLMAENKLKLILDAAIENDDIRFSK